MTRFISVLLWDFRLQYRYYFWITGMVVTAVWLALLSTLSETATATWIPVLIFADIGNIGLLFIAGILYLERRQGTLYLAAIMPVPTATWLSSKLISLTVLTAICALVIVLFNDESVNWLRIVPAAMLSGALFTSIGFLLAVPFDRILNYFLGMALVMTVLNLPILDYLGIVSTELMWLLPSQAALQLLAACFNETSGQSYVINMVVLLIWIGFIHWLGIRSFRRLISFRPQV